MALRLLSSLVSDTALGVLVLSLGKEILYLNAPAHRFMEDLRDGDPKQTPSARTNLPTPLARICDDLMERLGPPSESSHWPTIQVQRCLMGTTAAVLTRGVGLPDVLDPNQGKLIVMMEQIAVQSMAPPTSPLQAALTSREQSVVDGMAAGLTNKEIGARLNLREGTVKEYVKRIRMKVGGLSRGPVRSHVKNLRLGLMDRLSVDT